MDNQHLTDDIGPPIADATADSEPHVSTPLLPEAPLRASDGTFAPKAARLPGLSALLDEREKRQAAERRIAELEARQAPQDPLSSDPTVEDRLRAVAITASRKFAEKEYGKDVVAKVHDWALAKCDADPHFNHAMTSSDDPYESAYQAFNREQIIDAVRTPDDLAEFQAWKAAKAAPPPPQPPLPKSLATAPGNGAAGKAHVPVGAGQAYGSIIR